MGLGLQGDRFLGPPGEAERWKSGKEPYTNAQCCFPPPKMAFLKVENNCILVEIVVFHPSEKVGSWVENNCEVMGFREFLLEGKGAFLGWKMKHRSGDKSPGKSIFGTPGGSWGGGKVEKKHILMRNVVFHPQK